MKALVQIVYTVEVPVTDEEYRALDMEFDLAAEEDVIYRALDRIACEGKGVDRTEQFLGFTGGDA